MLDEIRQHSSHIMSVMCSLILVHGTRVIRGNKANCWHVNSHQVCRSQLASSLPFTTCIKSAFTLASRLPFTTCIKSAVHNLHQVCSQLASDLR